MPEAPSTNSRKCKFQTNWCSDVILRVVLIGKSLRHNGAFGEIISRLSLLAPTAHRCFAAKISVGYYLSVGTGNHHDDKIL